LVYAQAIPNQRAPLEFFILWIMTRIKERGWPKTEGFLRRRHVITEDVVVAAAQDAIRVAITIGASLPVAARAIAITCMAEGQNITRRGVDQWIDSASAMGEAKLSALSNYPQWLRFCSISASKSKEDTMRHFVWSPIGDKYEMGTVEALGIIEQAVALAVIAMSWALRHPEKSEDLFYDPDAVESSVPQELLTGHSIYSGWLTMAEMLVSRYSDSVGFQSYDDLP